MQLTGPQLDKFSEALRNAFSIADLRRVLRFKLNEDLDDYSANADRQQMVFELLEAANKQEWVDRLLIAARESAPGNTKLLVFAQQFGLSATAASKLELERLIVEANSFIDPDAFRQGLGEMEPRVARIEIPTNQGTAFGTGVLLGTDVLLTNYHVIEPLIHKTDDGLTASPVDVVIRFDYKVMRDLAGTKWRENPGRTTTLADNWNVDHSEEGPETRPPTNEELDYALIRLKDPVADDKLDSGATAASPRRGFVTLPADDHAFAADSSLFILQHPSGAPLKLAMDTRSVIGLFDNNLRVRYRTNTEPGSSGSPCFTPDWKLIALHHSGDPNFHPRHSPSYNEGIPISAIRDLLTKRGKLSLLGETEE